MAMEVGKVQAALAYGVREITVGLLIREEKESLYRLQQSKGEAIYRSAIAGISYAWIAGRHQMSLESVRLLVGMMKTEPGDAPAESEPAHVEEIVATTSGVEEAVIPSTPDDNRIDQACSFVTKVVANEQREYSFDSHTNWGALPSAASRKEGEITYTHGYRGELHRSEIRRKRSGKIEGSLRDIYISALERSSPEATDLVDLVSFSFRERRERHERFMEKFHRERNEQIERDIDSYHSSSSAAPGDLTFADHNGDRSPAHL